MSLDYGYIFSQIDKTKKKKRKRWTQADTDAAAKKLAEEKEARGPVVSQRRYVRNPGGKNKPETHREGTGGSFKKEPPVPKGGLATNRRTKLPGGKTTPTLQTAHSSGSGSKGGSGDKVDGRKLTEEEKKRREFTGQKRGTKREVKISDLKEGGTGELSDQAKLNRRKVRDAEMERLRRSLRDSEAKRKLERKKLQPKVSDLERLDAEAENRARDRKTAWHASRSGKKPGIGSGFWTPAKEDKKKKKRKKKRTAEEEKMLSDDWLEGTEQETTEEERSAEGQQDEDDDIGPIGKSLWKAWLEKKDPTAGLKMQDADWKFFNTRVSQADEAIEPECRDMIGPLEDKERLTSSGKKSKERWLDEQALAKRPGPAFPKEKSLWKSWLEKKVEGTKTDSSQYDETDRGFKTVKPKKTEQAIAAQVKQTLRDRKERQEAHYKEGFRKNPKGDPPYPKVKPGETMSQYNQRQEQRADDTKEERYNTTVNALRGIKERNEKIIRDRQFNANAAQAKAKPKQGTSSSYAPKGAKAKKPKGTKAKKPTSASKPKPKAKPNIDGKKWLDEQEKKKEPVISKKPPFADVEREAKESETTSTKLTPEEIASATTKTPDESKEPSLTRMYDPKKDKPADNDDDWENPMASQKSLYKTWLKQVTKPYDAKGKEIPPAKGREDWKARPPNMSVDDEESFMEYMEALPHEKVGTRHNAPPDKQSHFDKWIASKPKEYQEGWEEGKYDPDLAERLKVSDAKAGTLLDEDRAVQSGKVRPPTPKHLVRPSDKAGEGIGGMNIGSQRGLGHEASYKQDPGQTVQITEVKDKIDKIKSEQDEEGEQSKQRERTRSGQKDIAETQSYTYGDDEHLYDDVRSGAHGHPKHVGDGPGQPKERDIPLSRVEGTSSSSEGDPGIKIPVQDNDDQEHYAGNAKLPSGKKFHNVTISQLGAKLGDRVFDAHTRRAIRDAKAGKLGQQGTSKRRRLADERGHKAQEESATTALAATISAEEAELGKSAYENHEQDESPDSQPNKQQIPASKPGMDTFKSLYKKALIVKYNNIYKAANI